VTGRRGPARHRLRLALLLAAAALSTLAHARMNTVSAAKSGRLHVPDPARAKLFSLGFEPAVADYYWVQALQIVGGDDGPVEAHADQIGDAVDVVTTLDPWVDHPYRFAAVWLTSTVDQVRRADRLLAQGIAYHPLDWRNRFYLGYNEFFYLEDDARAADVLESAVGMPGAPRYLGAFVTRLRAKSSGLDTAALFLQELIRSTDDEYARAEYLKAWDEIATERRARRLDAARVEFRKRTGRDIRSPAELWSGPHAVLSKMPPPHPHFHGFEWILDPHSHRIVSSFYGTRYELHIHPVDERRRELWRPQLAPGSGEERGNG
jgi:hypothetical protein